MHDLGRLADAGDHHELMRQNALIGQGFLDGHEHNEAGHIIEDGGTRVRMQDKRLAKMGVLLSEVLPPEFSGDEEPDLSEAQAGGLDPACTQTCGHFAQDLAGGPPADQQQVRLFVARKLPPLQLGQARFAPAHSRAWAEPGAG